MYRALLHLKDGRSCTGHYCTKKKHVILNCLKSSDESIKPTLVSVVETNEKDNS
jgi:hypothetical protein